MLQHLAPLVVALSPTPIGGYHPGWGSDADFLPPFPKAAFVELDVWGAPVGFGAPSRLAGSRTSATVRTTTQTGGTAVGTAVSAPTGATTAGTTLGTGLGFEGGARLLWWARPSLGVGVSFESASTGGDSLFGPDLPDLAAGSGTATSAGAARTTTLTATTLTDRWNTDPDPWTGAAAAYSAVGSNQPLVSASGAAVGALSVGATGFDAGLSFVPALPGVGSGFALPAGVAGSPLAVLNSAAPVATAAGAGAPTMQYVGDAGVTFQSSLRRTFDATQVWGERVLVTTPNAELGVQLGLTFPRVVEFASGTARLANRAGTGDAAQTATRVDAGGGTGFTETTTLGASETRSTYAAGTLLGAVVGLRGRMWLANGLQLYGTVGWSPAVVGSLDVSTSTALSGHRTTTYTGVGANAQAAVTSGAVVVTSGVPLAEGATSTSTYDRRNDTAGGGPLASAALGGVYDAGTLGLRYELMPTISVLAEANAEALDLRGSVTGGNPTAALPFAKYGLRLGVDISL